MVLFISFFLFLSLPSAVALLKKKINMDTFYSSLEEDDNTNNWNEIIYKLVYAETINTVFSYCFMHSENRSIFSCKLPCVIRAIVMPPPKIRFI